MLVSLRGRAHQRFNDIAVIRFLLHPGSIMFAIESVGILQGIAGDVPRIKYAAPHK